MLGTFAPLSSCQGRTPYLVKWGRYTPGLCHPLHVRHSLSHSQIHSFLQKSSIRQTSLAMFEQSMISLTKTPPVFPDKIYWECSYWECSLCAHEPRAHLHRPPVVAKWGPQSRQVCRQLLSSLLTSYTMSAVLFQLVYKALLPFNSALWLNCNCPNKLIF